MHIDAVPEEERNRSRDPTLKTYNRIVGKKQVKGVDDDPTHIEFLDELHTQVNHEEQNLDPTTTLQPHYHTRWTEIYIN